MTTQAPRPAPDQPMTADGEMRIMRAILGNCDDMGISLEDAKRMAVGSIMNLRRAQRGA